MEQVGVGASHGSAEVVVGDPELLEKKMAAIRLAGPAKLQLFEMLCMVSKGDNGVLRGDLLLHLKSVIVIQMAYINGGELSGRLGGLRGENASHGCQKIALVLKLPEETAYFGTAENRCKVSQNGQPLERFCALEWSETDRVEGEDICTKHREGMVVVFISG
ncbi:5'-nucleotidase [Sarracenia purpurea var. burkii]